MRPLEQLPGCQVSENLLSLDQAAGKLGWEGAHRRRRLKRLLFARERQTKKPIMTRLGSAKKPAYRVTMSALRKHTPELFKSKVDDLAENFRNYLSTIDDRIAEVVTGHVTEHVEPRLQELWERDEKIAEQVNQLGRRVAALATVSTTDRERPRTATG